MPVTYKKDPDFTILINLNHFREAQRQTAMDGLRFQLFHQMILDYQMSDGSSLANQLARLHQNFLNYQAQNDQASINKMFLEFLEGHALEDDYFSGFAFDVSKFNVETNSAIKERFAKFIADWASFRLSYDRGIRDAGVMQRLESTLLKLIRHDPKVRPNKHTLEVASRAVMTGYAQSTQGIYREVEEMFAIWLRGDWGYLVEARFEMKRFFDTLKFKDDFRIHYYSQDHLNRRFPSASGQPFVLLMSGDLYVVASQDSLEARALVARGRTLYDYYVRLNDQPNEIFRLINNIEEERLNEAPMKRALVRVLGWLGSIIPEKRAGDILWKSGEYTNGRFDNVALEGKKNVILAVEELRNEPEVQVLTCQLSKKTSVDVALHNAFRIALSNTRSFFKEDEERLKSCRLQINSRDMWIFNELVLIAKKHFKNINIDEKLTDWVTFKTAEQMVAEIKIYFNTPDDKGNCPESGVFFGKYIPGGLVEFQIMPVNDPRNKILYTPRGLIKKRKTANGETYEFMFQGFPNEELKRLKDMYAYMKSQGWPIYDHRRDPPRMIQKDMIKLGQRFIAGGLSPDSISNMLYLNEVQIKDGVEQGVTLRVNRKLANLARSNLNRSYMLPLDPNPDCFPMSKVFAWGQKLGFYNYYKVIQNAGAPLSDDEDESRRALDFINDVESEKGINEILRNFSPAFSLTGQLSPQPLGLISLAARLIDKLGFGLHHKWLVAIAGAIEEVAFGIFLITIPTLLLTFKYGFSMGEVSTVSFIVSLVAFAVCHAGYYATWNGEVIQWNEMPSGKRLIPIILHIDLIAILSRLVYFIPLFYPQTPGTFIEVSAVAAVISMFIHGFFNGWVTRNNGWPLGIVTRRRFLFATGSTILLSALGIPDNVPAQIKDEEQSYKEKIEEFLKNDLASYTKAVNDLKRDPEYKQQRHDLQHKLFNRADAFDTKLGVLIRELFSKLDSFQDAPNLQNGSTDSMNLLYDLNEATGALNKYLDIKHKGFYVFVNSTQIPTSGLFIKSFKYSGLRQIPIAGGMHDLYLVTACDDIAVQGNFMTGVADNAVMAVIIFQDATREAGAGVMNLRTRPDKRSHAYEELKADITEEQRMWLYKFQILTGQKILEDFTNDNEEQIDQKEFTLDASHETRHLLDFEHKPMYSPVYMEARAFLQELASGIAVNYTLSMWSNKVFHDGVHGKAAEKILIALARKAKVLPEGIKNFDNYNFEAMVKVLEVLFNLPKGDLVRLSQELLSDEEKALSNPGLIYPFRLAYELAFDLKLRGLARWILLVGGPWLETGLLKISLIVLGRKLTLGWFVFFHPKILSSEIAHLADLTFELKTTQAVREHRRFNKAYEEGMSWFNYTDDAVLNALPPKPGEFVPEPQTTVRTPPRYWTKINNSDKLPDFIKTEDELSFVSLTHHKGDLTAKYFHNDLKVLEFLVCPGSEFKDELTWADVISDKYMLEAWVNPHRQLARDLELKFIDQDVLINKPKLVQLKDLRMNRKPVFAIERANIQAAQAQEGEFEEEAFKFMEEVDNLFEGKALWDRRSGEKHPDSRAFVISENSGKRQLVFNHIFDLRCVLAQRELIAWMDQRLAKIETVEENGFMNSVSGIIERNGLDNSPYGEYMMGIAKSFYDLYERGTDLGVRLIIGPIRYSLGPREITVAAEVLDYVEDKFNRRMLEKADDPMVLAIGRMIGKALGSAHIGNTMGAVNLGVTVWLQLNNTQKRRVIAHEFFHKLITMAAKGRRDLVFKVEHLIEFLKNEGCLKVNLASMVEGAIDWPESLSHVSIEDFFSIEKYGLDIVKDRVRRLDGLSFVMKEGVSNIDATNAGTAIDYYGLKREALAWTLTGQSAPNGKLIYRNWIRTLFIAEKDFLVVDGKAYRTSPDTAEWMALEKVVVLEVGHQKLPSWMLGLASSLSLTVLNALLMIIVNSILAAAIIR